MQKKELFDQNPYKIILINENVVNINYVSTLKLFPVRESGRVS